jgi:enediyne biosynthesis protein E4
VVLKGDGRGGFLAVSPAESGFVVEGDARAAAALMLDGAKRPALVIARCNGPVLLFTTTKP